MASEVDICNLALARLGDDATVASISPPEGSAQASHCARFYPIARDALLETHPWGFSTLRCSLSPLVNTTVSEWGYAYACPSDALNLLAVLPPSSTDDYSVDLNTVGTVPGTVNSGSGIYQPQPFSAETMPGMGNVIFTDQQYAVLRYTAIVTDPSLFSPLFADALAWLLASYLAGIVIKGESGAKMADLCEGRYAKALSKATVSDANQRRVAPEQSVPWMVNR